MQRFSRVVMALLLTLGACRLDGLVCWDPYTCSSHAFDPYYDPRWGGGVEFLGEYLYQRPSMGGLDYVIEDSRGFGDPRPENQFTMASLPYGSRRGIEPERRSGFRVGCAKVNGRGCQDVTLSFARIWMGDQTALLSPVALSGEGGQATRKSGGLWATFGHPDYLRYRFNDSTVASFSELSKPAHARIKFRSHYNCLDGQLALRRIAGCNIWLRGYLGLRGVQFDISEQANYSGYVLISPAEIQYQNHVVKGKSRTWGLGPRAGCDIRYDVASGVGLGAHLGASMLAATRECSLRHKYGLDPLDAENFVYEMQFEGSPNTIVIPEFDCRLGVNYITCTGNRYFVIAEVGYEYTAFINGLVRADCFHSGGTKRLHSRNYVLDGIYVSFTFRY